MNKSVIVGVALAVCAALYLFYQIDLPLRGSSEDLRTYQSEAFGFSFSYPNRYILTEQEVGNGERTHYSVVLTRPEDLPLAENSEGPATITVDVYQNNLDRLPLLEWLTGTSFSNFKLSDGTYAPVTVSGTDAVRYHWSGLYEANTVAFLRGDFIISFSGMYLAPEDQIVSDFESAVSSIRFLEQ